MPHAASGSEEAEKAGKSGRGGESGKGTGPWGQPSGDEGAAGGKISMRNAFAPCFLPAPGERSRKAPTGRCRKGADAWSEGARLSRRRALMPGERYRKPRPGLRGEPSVPLLCGERPGSRGMPIPGASPTARPRPPPCAGRLSAMRRSRESPGPLFPWPRAPRAGTRACACRPGTRSTGAWHRRGYCAPRAPYIPQGPCAL